MTWFPFQKNFLFTKSDLALVVASSLALGESRSVVIGVGEDHDIVTLALSEEVVGSLIVRARLLVRADSENPGERMTYSYSNSTLAVWIHDRDRQNTIHNIVNRSLPVPPRD
jgi:hypothetical protein